MTTLSLVAEAPVVSVSNHVVLAPATAVAGVHH